MNDFDDLLFDDLLFILDEEKDLPQSLGQKSQQNIARRCELAVADLWEMLDELTHSRREMLQLLASAQLPQRECCNLFTETL